MTPLISIRSVKKYFPLYGGFFSRTVGQVKAVEDVSLEEAKRQFEVNLFGLARITQLVLPKMREQKSGRIINISSHTIMKSNIPISKMHDLTNYNGWEIYKFSKLLSFLITNFLSKKYKNVKFISFDPGRMKTNFGAGNNFFLRYLTKLYLKILGKNPNIPAEKIVELIDAHKKNIKIKKNKKIINFNKINANVNNLNLQKKLWAETNKVFEINEKN